MQSSHFPFIKRRDLETGLSRPQCSTSPLCSRRPPQPSGCASGQGPDADADAQSGWSTVTLSATVSELRGWRHSSHITPPPPSPTHAPCPRTACRMIARVREIRRLSDASRLGSLKNKSSCAGLRRPLSFRRYPFPSHASSAKVLYVSPPLGPCAALVGAGVLNKSQH